MTTPSVPSDGDPETFDAARAGARAPTPMADVAAPITASYGKQPDNSERKAGPPNLIVGTLEDAEPA